MVFPFGKRREREECVFPSFEAFPHGLGTPQVVTDYPERLVRRSCRRLSAGSGAQNPNPRRCQRAEVTGGAGRGSEELTQPLKPFLGEAVPAKSFGGGRGTIRILEKKIFFSTKPSELCGGKKKKISFLTQTIRILRGKNPPFPPKILEALTQPLKPFLGDAAPAKSFGGGRETIRILGGKESSFRSQTAPGNDLKMFKTLEQLLKYEFRQTGASKQGAN